MNTRSQTILFGFFFLFFFSFSTLAQAANFGIKPAYPRPDNPRTDSIFVQTIEPGAVATDGVKVINSTNETKNLILYARDSAPSSGGGFACDQLSEKAAGVGAWIHFDISHITDDTESVHAGTLPETIDITIPSGSEIIIPFSITTPKNVSIGEHNGCILVQETKQNKSDAGVSLSLRSGIRVAVTVPGEVNRSLEFSDFLIEKKKGSIYLMPSIKNTGNVSIDTQAAVKVSYFFGLTHKTFGGEFPVLRGEIYDFNFELKKPFWGGLYRAQATFDYDTSSGAGIGVTTGEKLTRIKSPSKWFFSAPTILGIVTEIIILVFILFIIALKRLQTKKKKWIKRWNTYTVQKGDSLDSLAKHHKIHWDLLAEVNKIQPPYTIYEGQTLRIPPPRKKN